MHISDHLFKCDTYFKCDCLIEIWLIYPCWLFIHKIRPINLWEMCLMSVVCACVQVWTCVVTCRGLSDATALSFPLCVGMCMFAPVLVHNNGIWIVHMVICTQTYAHSVHRHTQAPNMPMLTQTFTHTVLSFSALLYHAILPRPDNHLPCITQLKGIWVKSE